MESSTNIPPSPIDPYVLEFAVNFRWLVSYATQHLDPTVEARYPALFADVANMERVLSQTSFEHGCTLNDMPFGALRISREMALYLLICDHLLGGCPPTMHPFLHRACGSPHTGTADGSSRRGRRGQAGVSALLSASRGPRGRVQSSRQSGHADLNVSFPSASESGDAENSDDDMGGTSVSHALDGKPVGLMGGSDAQPGLAEGNKEGESKESQAALILLRWLCAEGVLSEEELAATLNLEDSMDATSTKGGRSHAQDEQLRTFRRHQRLARRLAELIPFYLGAHVLISRSILLQYSATLLTADAVMQHVRRLETPLRASASYLPYSSLCPPSSVEGVLLEWFQAVMDSTKKQLGETASSSSSSLTQLLGCAALCEFLSHGPFCRDVLDPAERDFFRLVQSGECLCIALWFYCPDALPLTELSRALRDADNFISTHPPQEELYSHEETVNGLQRHQSICYWTAIFAASGSLGVAPLLTPVEVVMFGRTALPLHLFVFVQRLFAVLATKAEEEVRVSADSAWWEHVGNSDGYAEVVESEVYPVEKKADKTTASINAALPGAQHVLRQSMRDSFPPEAFQDARSHKEQDGGTVVEEAVVVAAESVGDSPTPAPLPAKDVSPPTTLHLPVVAPITAPASQLQSLTTGVRVANGEVDSRRSGDARRSSSRSTNSSNRRDASTSSATSTHFTVEFAVTQRGANDRTSKSSGAMETSTSVLRPMTARRRPFDSHTKAAAAQSFSGTTFTSVDTVDKVSTENQEKGDELPFDEGRRVVLAARVTDTYAFTPDEEPLSLDPAECPVDLQLRGFSSKSLAPQQRASTPSSKTNEGKAKSSLCTSNHPSVDEAETAAEPSAPLASCAVESRLSPPDPLALVDEDDQLPSSPQLPELRDNAATKPSSVLEAVTPATARGNVHQSSASSLSYSTDFVVQSGPQDMAETPLKEVAVAVDKSASFSTSATLTQETDKEPAVSAPPLPLATATQDKAGEELRASWSSSAVAIRHFHADDASAGAEEGSSSDDEVVAGTRDGEEHKNARSLSTPSDLSATSSSSVASHAQLKRPPPHERSASASSLGGVKTPTKPQRETVAQLPNNSNNGGVLSFPDATLADAPPMTGCTTNTNTAFRSLTKETAAPASSVTPSVTDIAVEYDGTSSLSCEKAAPGARQSFPTPTERDNENYLRALQLAEDGNALADAPSPSQLTSERSISSLSPHRAWLPSVMSPSPLQPDRALSLQPPHRQRAATAAVAESASSHRTLSEGSNVDGLSPLTPALTQSASEVFGTDYASLLEDAASSYVGPLHGRRPRFYDDDSWFSSVSHPNRQSIQSTAESMMSVGSARDSAHVRELLGRLRSMTIADLEHIEKEELRDALARQQEVVQQLSAALQERRSRAAVRAFPAGARPTLRKRQVHLRSPSEERRAEGPGSGQRGASRSLLADLGHRGGVHKDKIQRRRSVSGMTLESQASPTHSVRSDAAAQLAEPDVSSLLADILLPVKSVSPMRTKRK